MIVAHARVHYISSVGVTHRVHGGHVQTCDKTQLGAVTQPTAPLEAISDQSSFIIFEII